jgi:ammonium transporter, Amt family
MAFLGFNTAFAPTIGGIVGNPLYNGCVFLGDLSAGTTGLLSVVWWSMDTGILCHWSDDRHLLPFETAFASVILALVGSSCSGR